MSKIESTFETGDLGLTCNTGPYRINGQSCGWRRPTVVTMRCHRDALTRDRVTIDTVWENWRYTHIHYVSRKVTPLFIPVCGVLHLFIMGLVMCEMLPILYMGRSCYTEHKPKPKLLTCKDIANIAIFDVRTLNTINQLTELTASAAEHIIDIICIQEHRYYFSEVEIKCHASGKGMTFISASVWKNSINDVS